MNRKVIFGAGTALGALVTSGVFLAPDDSRIVAVEARPDRDWETSRAGIVGFDIVTRPIAVAKVVRRIVVEDAAFWVRATRVTCDFLQQHVSRDLKVSSRTTVIIIDLHGCGC